MSLGHSQSIETNQGYTDSNNSSTTNLTSATSLTFTGTWFNATDYSDLTCLVNTDQDGTLYLEYSMDTSITDRSKTITVSANVSSAHTTTILSKYMRVRYIAGADTTTFRIQTIFHKYANKETNVTISESISNDNDTILTRPSDYHYEVAMGYRTGSTTWNKFGYNDDVDTGTEIVAAFGGTWTPLTTASTLTIVSSSSADDGDPAGTGANSLVITGIDANYESQVELVTLNGTTNVVTTSTWLGVNRAAIYLSGSGDVNAGNISITATTGGVTQAYLPAGEGTTQQLIFFSRVNHTALADWMFLNAQKISGGGNPKVTFKGWVYSAVSQSKYEVLRIVINTVGEQSVQLNPSQPFVIGEKSAFWIEATTDTNNTVVSGRFSLIEVQN